MDVTISEPISPDDPIDDSPIEPIEDGPCSSYDVSLDDEFDRTDFFPYESGAYSDVIDLTDLFTSSHETSSCWNYALGSITPEPSEGEIFTLNAEELTIFSFETASAGIYTIELLVIDNYDSTEKSSTTFQITLEAVSDENDPAH